MDTIEQARITYQDYEAYLQAFKDGPFGGLRPGFWNGRVFRQEALGIEGTLERPRIAKDVSGERFVVLAPKARPGAE